jgi:hypothetical protein
VLDHRRQVLEAMAERPSLARVCSSSTIVLRAAAL